MINFCGAYIDSHEKEMLSQLSVTSMIDTCWRDGARQESFYLTHQQAVLARQYGGAHLILYMSSGDIRHANATVGWKFDIEAV
jgi:hypothetical protein